MTKTIKREIRKHFRATVYYSIISSRFCKRTNDIMISLIKIALKSYLRFSIIMTILVLILGPILLGIYFQCSYWLLLIFIGLYLSNELIKYEINKLNK